MTRVYLLVEGQTEETFVRELLAPHYAPLALYLTPILVSTSPGHKGGLVSYAKARREIERLCKQDANAYVTTLFDLYALPSDFPGKCTPEWNSQHSGADKARLIESALSRDIGQRNFIPYIQVHEFEALLFVAPERFADWTDHGAVNKLTTIAAQCTPEDINDNPASAPSKRIQAAMPDYQKAFHGPLIACDIGLDAMRTKCPHFADWLNRLERLATPSKAE